MGQHSVPEGMAVAGGDEIQLEATGTPGTGDSPSPYRCSAGTPSGKPELADQTGSASDERARCHDLGGQSDRQ